MNRRHFLQGAAALISAQALPALPALTPAPINPPFFLDELHQADPDASLLAWAVTMYRRVHRDPAWRDTPEFVQLAITDEAQQFMLKMRDREFNQRYEALRLRVRSEG